MNSEILDYYVAEYSALQNCFHCDKLKDAIFNNLSTINNKIVNDYKVIGIFKTLDEALECNKQLKKEFQRKEIKEKEDKIDELVNKITNIIKEY